MNKEVKKYIEDLDENEEIAFLKIKEIIEGLTYGQTISMIENIKFQIIYGMSHDALCKIDESIISKSSYSIPDTKEEK